MRKRFCNKSLYLLFYFLFLFLMSFIPARAAVHDDTETGLSPMDPILGDAEQFAETEEGLRYLGESGELHTEVWVEFEDNLYYFDENGIAVTGIYIANNHQYFFDEQHRAKFGLVDIGGLKFFFTPLLGMNHGFVSITGNEDLYYFADNGIMQTGFLSFPPEGEEEDPTTYYFAEDGKMQKGWLTIEEDTFYFNEDGKMLRRWNEIDGEWYYFDENNGAQKINSWGRKDGSRCYVGADGALLRDSVFYDRSIRFIADKEGAVRVDWVTAALAGKEYLIAFFLSAILVYFASTQKGKRSIVLGVLAVLVVSGLAGLRHTDVGYDVSTYVAPVFRFVEKNGSGVVTFLCRYYRMEPLFNIVMYASVVVFRTPQFALCVFSLLTNGFVYSGIRARNEERTASFAWLLYCFLFYNNTLNIMRQYIGVAILFYLFSEPKKLTTKRAIGFTLLAMGFHYASIIGFFFYAFYKAMMSVKISRKMKILAQIGVVLIPPVVPFFFGKVLGKAVQYFPVVFGKYSVFAYGHEANEGFRINRLLVFIVLIGVAIMAADIILQLYKNKSDNPGDSNRTIPRYYPLAVTACLMDLLYTLFNNGFNERFQYFPGIFRLEYFVHPFRTMRRRTGIPLMAGILFVSACYWLYSYVYMNLGLTVPYLFFLK